jgi:hypothetical protein
MTGVPGALATIRYSALRTPPAEGRASSPPSAPCSSERNHVSPSSEVLPAASVARFLYCTKPHSSAMPQASSATPPNDSSSFERSDSDGAMLRTGTR